jgi:hypothetical protein
MTTAPFKTRSPFVSAESLAMGAAAETIATAGGTIPQNTAGIWFFVPSGDNIHYSQNSGETPTSTTGIPVKASNWGYIKPGHHDTLIISDDGADVTLILVYERGSSRQDLAYSISEPV